MIVSLAAIQQQAFGKILKEELFANPSLSSAKISPDGDSVAYVGADEKGISNLFITTKNGPDKSHEQLIFFTTPEIIQFFWSGDSKKISTIRQIFELYKNLLCLHQSIDGIF